MSRISQFWYLGLALGYLTNRAGYPLPGLLFAVMGVLALYHVAWRSPKEIVAKVFLPIGMVAAIVFAGAGQWVYSGFGLAICLAVLIARMGDWRRKVP